MSKVVNKQEMVFCYQNYSDLLHTEPNVVIVSIHNRLQPKHVRSRDADGNEFQRLMRRRRLSLDLFLRTLVELEDVGLICGPYDWLIPAVLRVVWFDSFPPLWIAVRHFVIPSSELDGSTPGYGRAPVSTEAVLLVDRIRYSDLR